MEIFWRVAVFFVFSTFIALVSSDHGEQLEPASLPLNQGRLPDPVRNFFSELGDLFLTVDKTFSQQTAPKTNFADILKEQVYLRLRRPDHDYFERIQGNYHDLQKRVLTTLTKPMEDTKPSETLGLDIQNNNGKNYIDVRLPFLPFRTTVNSKKVPLGSDSLDVASNSNGSLKKMEPIENASKHDFDAVVNVAGSTVSVENKDSKFKLSALQMPPLEDTWKEFQKRMESIPINQRSKIIPTEDEIKIAVNRFLKDVPQSQEILDALRGRGINSLSVSRTGDLIDAQISQDKVEDDTQSKSAFDKYVEQLLENKAKWLPDFPLQRRKLAEESTTIQNEQENTATTIKDFISNTKTDSYTQETTVDYTNWNSPTGLLEEASTEIPTSAEIFLQDLESDSTEHLTTNNELNFLPETYYETDDENRSIVDYVFEPETTTEMQQEPITEVYQENEFKSILLLAFTPNGVPLKLRISTEIDNPIEYLHKSLTAAGVYINIPVDSFNNIEPVGNEVLQLGAGLLTTRVLYMDITNEQEFQSLVNILRLSKDMNGVA